MIIIVIKMEFNMGHSTKWLFLSTVFKLNWNVGFCGGGRIRGIVEKNPSYKDENQQKI